MNIVTKDNLTETLEKNATVILDLWAPWCGPCKSYGPIFEEVSKQYPALIFAKINVDEESEIARQFLVKSIPTTLFIKSGKVVTSKMGALTKEQLIEAISDL